MRYTLKIFDDYEDVIEVSISSDSRRTALSNMSRITVLDTVTGKILRIIESGDCSFQ